MGKFEARRSIIVAAVAAAGLLANGRRSNAQTLVTWTGPSGGSWSVGANWTGGVVPLDNGSATYNTLLSNNGTIVFDVPGISTLSRMTMGVNSVLDLRAGDVLNLAAGSDIGGTVVSHGGGFVANGPTNGLVGSARLYAANGGTITIGGTQYLTNSQLGQGWVLFSADGIGSAVSLPALNTMQYGYNNGRVDHYINATAGGLVNLSALTTLSSIDDDLLHITASGGGTVNLSGLQNIVLNSSNAVVEFNSSGGSSFNLPALSTITGGFNYTQGVRFNVSDAVFSLPQLSSASAITFNMAPGSVLNLPKLATASNFQMTVPGAATVNAATLTSLDSSQLDLSNGTFNAPNLKNFTTGNLVLGAGGTLTATSLTQVDNSGFAVSGGKTLTIADTNYLGFNRGQGHVIFQASGAASTIDASAMSSLQFGYNGARLDHYITATAGGLVNLSGLSNLSSYDDDLLHITASGGGTVDFSNLQNITLNSSNAVIEFNSTGGSSFNLIKLASINGGFNYTQGVRFNVADTVFTLPQLAAATALSFNMAAGSTLNLPKLATASNFQMAVPGGATVNAGSLVTLDSSNIDVTNGTFNAPNLHTFTTGDLVLGAGGTLSGATLNQIDNSGFRVSGGKTLTLGDVSYVGNNRGQGFVLFQATGLGSTVNASAMNALQFGYNGARLDHYINATAGGLVNLSGDTTLSSFDDDLLHITASGGGTVDLSGLQNIVLNSSNAVVEFNSSGGSSFNLPALSTITGGFNYTQGVRFNIADIVFTLPQLTSASAITFNMNAGSTLNLPKLATASNFNITVLGGTTVNAATLNTLDSSNLDLSDGTFNAPNLHTFTTGNLVVGAGGVFNVGALNQVDNSGFVVSGGKTITLSDPNYVGNNRGQGFVLFQATGAGSAIDAHAMSTLQFGYNGARLDHYINATAGGLVNLSGLNVLSSYDDDLLHITASGGGTVDLRNLQAINLASSSNAVAQFNATGGTIRMDSIKSLIGPGAIQFNMTGGATLVLPGISVPNNSSISATGLATVVDIGGNLELQQSTSLVVGGGSTIKIAGSFQHYFTDETRMNTTAAVVQMHGPEPLTLEVAGTDLGASNPANNGNFGFGQLLIGDTNQATVISLVDVIDNGNRNGTAGAREALYLFGLGGPQGLVLKNGSTLILSNLDVYTNENNQWVSLQSLFTGGQTIVPYTFGGSDGFLVKNLVNLKLNWVSPNSGAWNTAANWDLNTAPDAPYDVTIRPANGVNVAGPLTSSRVRDLVVDAGTGTTVLTWPGPGTLTIGNGMEVGPNGRFDLLGGGLVAGSIVNANVLNQSSSATLHVTAVVNSGSFTSSGTLTDMGAFVNTGTYTQLAGVASVGALDGGGGTASVAAGASLTAERIRQTSLTVAGHVNIRPSGAPNGTSAVSSLSIPTGGVLDLANNSLIIDYTGPLGTLVNDTRLHLKNGELMSSLADATHRLGYGDNAVLGRTTFAGLAVDSSSVLIKYTYGGDANLDGKVDVTDLGALATSWQTSGPWTGGDFNYDGFVDVSDLGVLATDWQLGVGNPLGPSSLAEALAAVGLGSVSVPEPGTVLGLAAVALMRRRRPRSIAAARL